MAYIELEKLHRLHDGYIRAFDIHGHALLLVQDNGRTHLLINRCPHMDARMDRGRVENDHLRCPVHGIAFSLSTGLAEGPMAHCLKQLETLPLHFEGNGVGVLLD